MGMFEIGCAFGGDVLEELELDIKWERVRPSFFRDDRLCFLGSSAVLLLVLRSDVDDDDDDERQRSC